MNKLQISEFPLYFEIETSHTCNARCPMCAISKWGNIKKPFMDDSLFKKIADEIIQHKDIVRVVDLTRDGEPLMDKKLEDKIKYLKNGGIRHVNISTNASLLTKRRCKSIIESGIDEIMFSVDGYYKETFEKIRKGLNYDIVKSNILRFIKYRDSMRSDLKIRVRMVLQDDNRSEADIWGNYWKCFLKDKDEVYHKKIHNWGNQVDCDIDKNITTIPCSSVFNTMIIKYNGNVIICPADFYEKYSSGNLIKDTISNIWHNGEYFNMFRKIHNDNKRNDLELCRYCRWWDSTIKKVY
jgi:radical SAM protein with 4Fe4S-binding SPASM domain